MDKEIVDRRRLLQWFALGSLSVPAIALAGCASGGTQPPKARAGGGNRGGEKGGRGGGLGGGGNR